MDIRDVIFTIFDTETTGFYHAKGDKITELAAVKYKNGEVIDTFESLVNPEREIPAECVQITGITNDLVADAPVITEVMPKFLDFIEGTVLVAHNAEFDMSFLNGEAMMINPFYQAPDTVCTKILSRTTFPREKFHNLDTVTYRYGLKTVEAQDGRHRAMPDVEMLIQVFEKLLVDSKATTLSDLLAKSN